MASAYELAHALSSGDKLAFLAHLNPRIWEVVGGGPAFRRVADAVALNPQPLPPAELGYHQVVAMGVAAIAAGDGGARTFMQDLDDWCGTGWPRRWPRPKKLDAEEIRDVLLGAAFGAAHLAGGYEGGEMGEAFTAAAKQAFDAALATR